MQGPCKESVFTCHSDKWFQLCMSPPEPTSESGLHAAEAILELEPCVWRCPGSRMQEAACVWFRPYKTALGWEASHVVA